MAEMILRLHEGDVTVTGSLGRLQTPGRTVVTESGGLGNLATLAAGDTLFILGHGSPSTLGGKSAEALAKLLADADFKSGISIELVACNSGTGSAPFALELKTQLVSRKIVPRTVAGGTNYMQVKGDGSLQTAGYDWGTRTWAPEVVDGTETVMTPWGPRKRNVVKTFKTA
jgi:hypothetical protein